MKFVVDNIKRLRAQRRWSLAELSDELAEAGRPILPTGLQRLEHGKRRVDVDDLMAFAVAFKVAPETLLVGASCEYCEDAPPAGFTCNACGRVGK